MNCDDVRSIVPEVITGASAERAEVTEHLARCATCRREVDEIARVVGLVRGVAKNDSPDAAESLPRFEEVLATVRAPRRRIPRLLLRAAILLVAALAGAATEHLRHSSAAQPTPLPSEPDVRVVARAAAANEPGGLGASLAVLDVLSRPRGR